jgi:hypothetical protein
VARLTNATSAKIAFLAVLIYEDGPGRRCEEPRVYHTTHPEMAENEVATIAKVRATVLENIAAIRGAAANPEAAEAVGSILGHLERGRSAT